MNDTAQDTIATAGAASPCSNDNTASLGDTVSRVVSAAKDFTSAEITLAKKRGSIIASAAQYIAIFGVIAFIIAFGMIVTLMVGAVMALAPHWGIGLALLTVTGGALFVVLLCGIGIKMQIGRIKEGVR